MLFAVIPTIGERNDTLIPMVNLLLTEGVAVIIIDNGTHPVPEDKFVQPGWYVIRHDWAGEPVNLSKLWNMGLDLVSEVAEGDPYVVAVLNDDLVLSPGIVHQLSNAIQYHGAAAAFICPFGTTGLLDFSSPLHLGNRMIGYAFALRGDTGLRADERFLWWWGDTDLDIQARAAGGVVGIVPTQPIQHKDPNGYTNRRPELAEQAGRDRDAFRAKHGYVPW